MWQNFTTGWPQGEIQTYSDYSGYESWLAGNGQGGWTWADSPELHADLPSSWPENFTFSF